MSPGEIGKMGVLLTGDADFPNMRERAEHNLENWGMCPAKQFQEISRNRAAPIALNGPACFAKSKR